MIELILAEELLLLVLNGKSGKLSPTTFFGYSISGALLMDLYLQGRISLEEKKRKVLVKVVNDTPCKNVALNRVLEMIQSSPKEYDLKKWLYEITRKYNSIRKMLLDSLVEKGVLDCTEIRQLRIFKATRYPLLKPEIKESLLTDLQIALLVKKESDDELLALLSIIRGGRILPKLIEKEQRKQAEKRIEELVGSEKIGSALKETIDSWTALWVVYLPIYFIILIIILT